MEDLRPNQSTAATILDVMREDLCARAILDHVPVRELVRSERVCRRWQEVVRDYLRGCRPLNFVYNYAYYDNHTTIFIGNCKHSLPLIIKTLDKWGPYIIKVIIDISKKEYFDILALKCPKVQEITIVLDENDKNRLRSISKINKLRHLKHVALDISGNFRERDNSDKVLGEVLQRVNVETIEIEVSFNDDLDGSFLKYLNINKLKSLTLMHCKSLSVPCLLSAVHNLQAVTSLTLHGNPIQLLSSLHLLINMMTNLEELALSSFKRSSPMSKELTESISHLVNLKCLDMSGCFGLADDSLLEALAQGCKKLDHLDVRGSATIITSRGIAALARRASAALTTLQFGFTDIDDETLETYFFAFKRDSMYQELEKLGLLELRWQWFKTACSRSRGLQLQLKPEETVTENKHLWRKLKIIMT